MELQATKRMIRRAIGSVMVGTLLSIGAGAFGVTSGVAHAAAQDGYGGSGDTEVACSASMDWVRITVAMVPERGYSTQNVAFRNYIRDMRTGSGFWTSWTTGVASTGAQFKTTNITYLAGYNLQVYSQYAWYGSGGWHYAGEWAPSYLQVIGASQYETAYCAT
jgi:hypothetical protein